MVNFWKAVNSIIRDADILLLVLDARFVENTRNKEIEEKVNKPLIYVITKSDLADKEKVEPYKKELNPCVFISARKFYGTKKLRERIIIEGKKKYGDKKIFKVGVLGYPNVGKSSLINMMKGKSSASTSANSGHTKGIQKVKSDNKITFLDAPGVIPYKEKDDTKHATIGAIDYNKVKDPDLIVMRIMENYEGKIEDHYDIDIKEDKEESVEEIAKKKNIIKKGAEPDIERTARMILKDWQEGKIK